MAQPVTIGEPNFTQSYVSFVRSCEESTCSKVLAYALSYFLALVLTATVAGIPVVLMGMGEYARQTAEQAVQAKPADDVAEQLRLVTADRDHERAEKEAAQRTIDAFHDMNSLQLEAWKKANKRIA